jgi:hypothetical protein
MQSIKGMAAKKHKNTNKQPEKVVMTRAAFQLDKMKPACDQPFFLFAFFAFFRGHSFSPLHGTAEAANCYSPRAAAA